MQSAMRAGRIRILLGTTEKRGVGLNVQNRLKAEIHLDLPQRPYRILCMMQTRWRSSERHARKRSSSMGRESCLAELTCW